MQTPTRIHEECDTKTEKRKKNLSPIYRYCAAFRCAGISRRCCSWLFIGIGVGYRAATSSAIALCIEQWQTFTLTSSHTNWFWKTKTAATDTKERWGEWETSEWPLMNAVNINFDATFRCGATFFSLIVRCSAFTSLSTSVACRLPSQDSTSNRNLITTQWTIRVYLLFEISGVWRPEIFPIFQQISSIINWWQTGCCYAMALPRLSECISSVNSYWITSIRVGNLSTFELISGKQLRTSDNRCHSLLCQHTREEKNELIIKFIRKLNWYYVIRRTVNGWMSGTPHTAREYIIISQARANTDNVLTETTAHNKSLDNFPSRTLCDPNLCVETRKRKNDERWLCQNHLNIEQAPNTGSTH